VNHLAALLGLAPGARVLILGAADLDLEAALMAAIEVPVTRSAAGIEVEAGAFDLVALGREAAGTPSLRRALLIAAAHAVKPSGLVAVEFPNRTPFLSPLLLAYEGLTERNPAAGGLSLDAARALCRSTGLGRQTSFLSLPSLADPKVVLPLDSPPAAAFHFRPPFFVETFRRRCLRRCLGLLAASGSLPSLSPTFAILATRDVTA
jgi:hypothetical protein